MIDTAPPATLVTALLDLGRGAHDVGLAADQHRHFSEYLAHFEQLLGIDAPLLVYTSPDLEPLIWRHRQPYNTVVKRITQASLEVDFPGFNAVQKIRCDKHWRDQAAWLSGSPQAQLAHYNPLVMSKLAMLDNSARNNPFASEHFLWIDAGITRTCGALVTQSAWLEQLTSTLHKFLICSYPYSEGTEIHGFPRTEMSRWAFTDKVAWVARGGLFGGSAAAIGSVKAAYDALLKETLEAGLMGTEESVMTLVAHRHPEHFSREEISSDGLLQPFFASLIARSPAAFNKQAQGMSALAPRPLPLPRPADQRPSVYVLTFNCPKQLALLLNSWHTELHENASALYVVDNSTDADCALANQQHCQRYGGEYLGCDNLGISGGRQFVADHFHRSGAQTMLFLEDDMLLSAIDGVCPKGMQRSVDHLLPRAQAVLLKEKLDFLKLSFSEFFGSNDQQWAWHNVSEQRRLALWPDYPRRSQGLALDEIPPTQFDHQGSIGGLPYATGEVYYCNWPQLVSHTGNKKLFLETRFPQPNESKWMAHLYECSRRKQIRSGVLLASPIEHRREFHYVAKERRES